MKDILFTSSGSEGRPSYDMKRKEERGLTEVAGSLACFPFYSQGL